MKKKKSTDSPELTFPLKLQPIGCQGTILNVSLNKPLSGYLQNCLATLIAQISVGMIRGLRFFICPVRLITRSCLFRERKTAMN